MSSEEPLNVRRYLSRRDLQQGALDLSMNQSPEDDKEKALESDADAIGVEETRGD